MLAEIITIGDEILIGQIIDTNSAFISKELNKIGVKIYQITSIQDDRDHILQAFKDAKKHADLVIVTGGLGPTKDDITKQTFCDFFEDTLIEDQSVVENVTQLFKKYQLNKPLPANFLQAMVPSKATILTNQYGTAPGMWMEKDETVFVSLPGVPYEMKHLVLEEVLPSVIKRFNRPYIYHKTLLTYGLGESAVAERIADWENSLPKTIKLAYLPSLGKVRLRLSSSGEDEVFLKESIDSRMEVLSEMLSDIAIGFEDETSIVGRIAHILNEKKQTLSLAESCTGGAIAERITAEAGASSFFMGSIVPYKTELKTQILGVPSSLIEEYSVVSIEVAESMAVNSCKLFNTDYAIATTGIAGPTKGDGKDEVGTVCIAIASPRGIVSEKFNFGNDRYRVIEKTINKAFEMILKEISKN
ncbi:competence/damage-inducible protein CinA-like protein [Aequorivita sublithincola DSM 14238]|uniref:CinA-like protein n=1 Tax=Aequorivita sublithincola (strain DSM 14238 / LMG 21431 / ACAM 643 / 9-3) TaxID=746697 RepID=I3YX35_AEQSU|nr:competence/damage-inducible protein A [Aequorivita sublithincola]AFL81553.1 competence/damage-inducible protein CinA-like protein [Aequorivita sublithincola DSM 14238]